MNFCLYKNTEAAATKATCNDYVGDPHKLPQTNTTSEDRPYVNNDAADDVFDPYATLGNLDPTDLVQFAWQIACGMVNYIMYYLTCVHSV